MPKRKYKIASVNVDDVVGLHPDVESLALLMWSGTPLPHKTMAQWPDFTSVLDVLPTLFFLEEWEKKYRLIGPAYHWPGVWRSEAKKIVAVVVSQLDTEAAQRIALGVWMRDAIAMTASGLSRRQVVEAYVEANDHLWGSTPTSGRLSTLFGVSRRFGQRVLCRRKRHGK